MKVLHVITSLATGGAEKLMVDLLPRLISGGIETELAIFNGKITPFYNELADRGVTVHRLMPNGGNVYNPVNLFKLILLIRKGKYDIVHTHNTAPQLFAALISVMSKRKFYTTEHGGSNRRRSLKGFVAIDRWMYNRYDKIICISHKAEDSLREYLGRCKSEILTINNGVDVLRYVAATPTPELESIAPGSRKLMMVAGFRWEKDQDTIINALLHLPDSFHLFLVGDGVRRTELKLLADTLNLSDRVHFLGIRSDVASLLHSADYIVMSSHFEGLSLSSVEGMCAGKPFIASDVDGLREVVNGAGILFPHHDSKALADTILRLESTPEFYTHTAQSCRERAKQFDISAMAENYLNQYSSLIR